MGITAIGPIHARVLASGDPRRSLALMIASFGFGQVIAPVFAGYTHGIAGSFVILSLIASVALVLAAWLGFRARGP